MRITRRQFLASSSIVAVAAALPFPRALAGRRQEPFQMLRRNVGTFVERGGTIGWLVADDALVVVDTQFPESAGHLWTGLQERTDRRIDLLINTHHHGDHTSGNPTLQPHAEHLLAHENVPIQQRRVAESQDDQPEPVVADVTFSDTWTGDVGDETITLRYYGPAHTNGDSVTHFEKANVAHVGDLVFNRMPCFIDLPGGASTAGHIDVLEAVHAAFDDDTLFIFGHGNPDFGVTGTRADLLVMRDFLTGMREYVQKGIDAGKAEEEITGVEKVPGFPDHYVDSWAQGIPNALTAVYQELTM